MNPMQALAATDRLMTSVIEQLAPEHREKPTPCTEWNVHEVCDHVVRGCHLVAHGLQGEPMPDAGPDYMADGPGKAWADAYDTLTAAATPEMLAATHDMPFGPVTGEQAVSVMAADAVTHAWDIAKGADVDVAMPDDLAEFALSTWQTVITPEARPGGGFGYIVPVADDAPALDRLLGFTGRRP
jgi:uncharacterized protein (TIGR03086 family)